MRQNSVEHKWEFDMYMPEMLKKTLSEKLC